jgi:mono/diheme cytochrome c family protein
MTVQPAARVPYRCLAAVAVAIVGLADLASAQEPDASAQEPDFMSVALGEALYRARCASCHGTDARGDGPAAAKLSVRPSDLTQISQRAGGNFPHARVVEIITYGGNIAAHGSGPMPVWGKVFSEEGGGGRVGAAHSRQSLVALKRYLETIQK